MENSLTPNQLKAVELLIVGTPVSQAAKLCKVDQRTLWNWRKNPQFQQEVERQKIQFYDDSTNTIRGLLGDATKHLAKLINNADTPHSTRMKAIEFVINTVKPEQQKLDILQAVKVLVENNALAPEVLEKVGTAFSTFEKELKSAFRSQPVD